MDNYEKIALKYQEVIDKFNELDISYEEGTMPNGDRYIRSGILIGDTDVKASIVFTFETEGAIIHLYLLDLVTIELEASRIQSVLALCNEFNRTYLYLKMGMKSNGKIFITYSEDLESFSADFMLKQAVVAWEILEETDYLKRLLAIK